MGIVIQCLVTRNGVCCTHPRVGHCNDLFSRSISMHDIGKEWENPRGQKMKTIKKSVNYTLKLLVFSVLSMAVLTYRGLPMM